MADDLSQTLSARCFLPRNQDRVTKSLQNKDVSPPDSTKKRGRPRMAPTGDSTRMDRRAQVRYAQRTYRHKKELRHRTMEHRVTELESTLHRVSDSLSDFFAMAIDSDLHVTHPHLFDRLNDTVTHLKRATGEKEDRDREKDPGSREIVLPVIFSSANVSVSPEGTGPFGYIVNCLQDSDIDGRGRGRGRRDPRDPRDNGSNNNNNNNNNSNNSSSSNNNNKQAFQRKGPSHDKGDQIERPLHGSTQYTYSFAEHNLLRVLQRYCLEYSYRVFSDPGADPRDFYRVFRLVPCVKYREKMGKYLLCLVRSGSRQRLDIPALPFYCIGGAGTHYPRVDEGGKRVYHEKMRLPRRILATFASLVDADVAVIDRQRLLELAGLDGTWLDVNDVVGYLEEKGVLGGSQ
ncbi:hypothetical protein BJY01DRAFT_256451, partial [Aspergillus pseudoustus]